MIRMHSRKQFPMKMKKNSINRYQRPLVGSLVALGLAVLPVIAEENEVDADSDPLLEAAEKGLEDAKKAQMALLRDQLATLNASRPELDFSNEISRALSVAKFKAYSNQKDLITFQMAEVAGVEKVKKDDQGNTMVLRRFDKYGRPVYMASVNANSRISQDINPIGEGTDLGLQGNGLTVGVWEVDRTLVDHVEFDNRVIQVDESQVDYGDHAVHVVGTIAARGQNPRAKGMAPRSSVFAFDIEGDLAEMGSNAAIAPGGGSTTVLISNHSYGYAGQGWAIINGIWVWRGSPPPERFDPRWGGYDQESSTLDAICHTSEYYLPVIAASNDAQAPGPNAGEAWGFVGVEGDIVFVGPYQPGFDPSRPVQDRDGFDTVAGGIQTAKNALTVGAVTDAVSGGSRDPSAATIAPFSSKGPVNDGRLKPEISANGVDLFSPVVANRNSYKEFSGTSMAAPSVAGGAILLQQLAKERNGGRALRAATIKGLICHTADDRGTEGPDYTYGYGLANFKAASDLMLTNFSVPATVPSLFETSVSFLPTSTDFRKTIFQITTSGGPLRATICWTDPASDPIDGAQNPTPALVNDLDLRIVGPGGQVYQPWRLGGLSNADRAATRGDNNLDNIEQVYIPNAEPGIYNVMIIADRFQDNSLGGQRFSLLLTGQRLVNENPIGVEPPIDPVQWPFEVEPVAEFPAGLGDVVTKVVNCFRVPIYGTEASDDDDLLQVAHHLGEYIDNDEDGVADNGLVHRAVIANDSFIIVFKDQDEFDTLNLAGVIPSVYQNAFNVRFIMGDQIRTKMRRGRLDQSRVETLKLWLRAGYSSVTDYTDVFGELEGSVIEGFMRKAQDDVWMFGNVAMDKPGWFHVDSTSITQLVSEYFYYVMGSRIGLFDFSGGGRTIRADWDLDTEDKLRGGDLWAYYLVNKPEYRLPRKLPNNEYEPDVPPGVPFF